jgi:hypothetical protein
VDSRHTDHGIVNCMHIGYSGWVIRGPHSDADGSMVIMVGEGAGEFVDLDPVIPTVGDN